MTVKELMEQLEYFPKDAVVIHKDRQVDGCYFTRDYLPGDTERRSIVVIV